MEAVNCYKKYKVMPSLRVWENLQENKNILTLMSDNVKFPSL